MIVLIKLEIQSNNNMMMNVISEREVGKIKQKRAKVKRVYDM
jgi:hypothetical protein